MAATINSLNENALEIIMSGTHTMDVANKARDELYKLLPKSGKINVLIDVCAFERFSLSGFLAELRNVHLLTRVHRIAVVGKDNKWKSWTEKESKLSAIVGVEEKYFDIADKDDAKKFCEDDPTMKAAS